MEEDRIIIDVDRLRLYCYHGVSQQERKVGNEFEVSVRLDYPAAEAVASDNLGATINYAEVCTEIKEVMSVPSALLEHVAGRIKKRLLERYPRISGGRVRVAKLAPPIPGVQLGSVAVELRWGSLK